MSYYYRDRILNWLFDTFLPSRYACNMLSGLAAQLKKDSRITFICKGNICRSAFAEHHFKSILPASTRVNIFSAGIHARDGLPPDPTAQEIAKQFSVNLDNHSTTAVCSGLLEKSDLLLVMEPAQMVYLKRIYPEFKDKIFLFSSLCMESESLDSWIILDPYGKDDTLFRETFHIICKGNEKLLALITANS